MKQALLVSWMLKVIQTQLEKIKDKEQRQNGYKLASN